MKRTFVVLTEQRSGSNALVNALSHHPQIYCFGEAFRSSEPYRDLPLEQHPGVLSYLHRLPPAYHDDEYRKAHPGAYLRSLWRLRPGFDYYGFKLMLRQHPRFTEELIADPVRHVVILKRENALARYSSGVKAKITGEGAATHPDQIKSVRVPFDRDSFLTYLERSDKQWAKIDRLVNETGCHCMWLEYCSLLQGDGINEVLGFLGATTGLDLHTILLKRNTSVIIDRFEAPDDVRRTLDEIGRPEWATEGGVDETGTGA